MLLIALGYAPLTNAQVRSATADPNRLPAQMSEDLTRIVAGLKREVALNRLKPGQDWPERVWPYLLELVKKSHWTYEDGKRGKPDTLAMQARWEIGKLCGVLSTIRNDDAVCLLGPLLEAKGGYFLHGGDVGSSPPQSLAMDALVHLSIKRHPLKGRAPGADRLDTYEKAAKRYEYEDITLPDVRGTLDDWRRWWSEYAAAYKAKFELPEELRAAPVSRQ